MTSHIRILHRALRTTAIGTFAALLVGPIVANAFNPNEGAEPPASPTRTRPNLPSTAPLMDPMPKLVFPPLTSARQTPIENQAPTITAPAGAYVQPIPPALPPIVATSPSPQFPPVDAAVAARAAQELQNTAPAQTGFIAPAPLLAVGTAVPTPQTPIENPAQTAPTPVGAIPVAAQPQLSDASRDILSKFPSKLSSGKPLGSAKGKNDKLAINRLSPDIQAIVKPETKIESYDAVGLSIKVQRPGLDTNFELNRAYTALTAGDSTAAIQTYKNILSSEPSNEDALFGLATAYHRTGNLEHARPYYAQLLKVNPNHRDGLNNFLALVSDEAPQEALAELERLEQRNPDFSPIPAQEAAVLMKTGMIDQAREKMLRAIELSPDNLTYKYNLAIMLDKQGNYVDAGALYRLLIDASLKGEKIPASLETIQKRLNFIATASNARNTVGG